MTAPDSRCTQSHHTAQDAVLVCQLSLGAACLKLEKVSYMLVVYKTRIGVTQFPPSLP
jgi:hypothetical protein